jgi:UrcA family protein
MSKFHIAALAAAVSLAAIGAAHAASSDPNVVTLKVSIADLNLATPTGAKVALKRVRHAADQICNSGASELDLQQQAAYQTCMTDVMGRAVEGSPELTALVHPKGPTAMASAAR